MFFFFCFSRVGVHLSAEGSKIVVEEILKVLKGAEWEPSLQGDSMGLSDQVIFCLCFLHGNTPPKLKQNQYMSSLPGTCRRVKKKKRRKIGQNLTLLDEEVYLYILWWYCLLEVPKHMCN